MKIHIGKEFPPHFREAYPGEFELFHHFETTAGIPNVLFAVTTWKENGQPNVCFHGWSCFHGDKTRLFRRDGQPVPAHPHLPEHPAGGLLLRQLPAHGPLRKPGGDHPPERAWKPTSSPPGASPLSRATPSTPRPLRRLSSPWSAPSTASRTSAARASPPWSSARCSTPLWRRATPGATAAGTARRALCCWCPRPKTCSPGRRGSPALPRCALKNWIEPQAIGKYRKKESP